MSEQNTEPKAVISQESPAPNHNVKKIIVAIHGIGDQFQFATIQTVANRLEMLDSTQARYCQKSLTPIN